MRDLSATSALRPLESSACCCPKPCNSSHKWRTAASTRGSAEVRTVNCTRRESRSLWLLLCSLCNTSTSPRTEAMAVTNSCHSSFVGCWEPDEPSRCVPTSASASGSTSERLLSRSFPDNKLGCSRSLRRASSFTRRTSKGADSGPTDSTAVRTLWAFSGELMVRTMGAVASGDCEADVPSCSTAVRIHFAPPLGAWPPCGTRDPAEAGAKEAAEAGAGNAGTVPTGAGGVRAVTSDSKSR
mmetsp:Transcript_69782/g.185447  ORF Transcript_69782/g.185447 Transcript_69782/m.185447 type:complete len:241 (-) Transcript_69782:246-968(-)